MKSKIQYYSCTLIDDVVLNASLATEGNMKTLDYIPGSNFWGIVASKLYGELVETKAYDKLLDLFHNGVVSFGDANLAINGQPSYRLPYSLFLDKLKSDILKHPVYVHPTLDKIFTTLEEEHELKSKQLKQHRSGFLNSSYEYLPGVEKKFALKSAYDRKSRKSEEEKMFGFESIQSGQQFIFSVKFKNEEYFSAVNKALTEKEHRIGKSKSAEYGRVRIEPIKTPKVPFKTFEDSELLLVYVASNLCLIDEYGAMTFQPDAERDFKIQGKIRWSASQIKTYSYSPWNNHRKTTDAQRNCILRGSVIAIDITGLGKEKLAYLPQMIGKYQAEGFGRVLYNPDFLAANPEDATWARKLTKYTPQPDSAPAKVNIISPLAKHLKMLKDKDKRDFEIGAAVIALIKNSGTTFNKITNSQWGRVRKVATSCQNKIELQQKLFGTTNANFIHKKTNNGILVKGVAAQRYWDKNDGKAREVLWKVIEEQNTIAPLFIAKFTAEKAKRNKNKTV